MDYREHSVIAELKAFVQCFWTIETGSRSTTHRVLPDGCIDYLFEVGPRTRALLVGATTRPMEADVQPDTSLVGVRFRPGAARAWIGFDADTITDQLLPLDEIWKDSRSLLARTADAKGPEIRVRSLQQALLARLEKITPEEAARRGFLAAAIQRIRRSHGNLSIEQLARSLGCSRQHLAREFGRNVGLTPKQLARIFRFEKMAHEIRCGAPLAQLAAVLGYSDQAHLSHECRALCLRSPGELRFTR